MMNRITLLKRVSRASTATVFVALAACGLAEAGDTNANVPAATVDQPLATAKGSQTLVVAGGCFWGVDAVFKHVKGVTSVTSGYAGGDKATADYDTVSTGSTGHAESVDIVYDPSQVTLGQLLRVFFSVAHNPTELNRQGPDHGTQYRSAIFYKDADQKRVIDAYIAQLQAAKVFNAPIVTQVTPLVAFYPAEAYHQNYLALHPMQPYIVINDKPKVEALKTIFPQMYRDS
jgi:peptide-methionine (S)-S-oxide reductase